MGDSAMCELRAILGDGPSDDALDSLLARTAGDVAAAANAFFDGTHHMPPPAVGSSDALPDDVMSTLFKTLEEVGRKLAERDQQLDMTTRVCEVLQRRLHDLEQSVAKADADASESQEAEEASLANGGGGAETSSDHGDQDQEQTVLASRRFAETSFHLFRLAIPRILLPLHLLSWLGSFLGVHQFAVPRPLKRSREDNSEESEPAVPEEPMVGGGGGARRRATGARSPPSEAEGLEADGEEGEEGEESEEGEFDGRERELLEKSADDARAQMAQLAASVAAAQASAQAALDVPSELLQQISAWEKQQSAAEADWRQRQIRLYAEFEERKRRLQEAQQHQRKKLRESCDEALCPLYTEGSVLCAQLEKLLRGKWCRFREFVPATTLASPSLQSHSGPLARITGVTFGRIDSPVRMANCPSRSASGVQTSSGVVVTMEKLVDRNGIAMLPAADNPMLAFRPRNSNEVKVPLRLLGARVKLLSEAETAEAQAASEHERVFVVRYSGGEDGNPIEPVQILPEGLSLAEYDISFAAGVSALRVDHRTDGPVKCLAEPVARKEVFAETPVELYTQEIDHETHNIVQVYFSDLREEVSVDVLNLTGTDLTLQDAECLAFPVDASGTALNYKIIVRDATVIAVLYKEGEQIRQSPFVEHRLPSPGAYVALSDGGLGVLQSLPRGLVVARTPRDLPAHEPQYAPRAGLRPKGKHPAELPGMADVKLLQEHGGVVWPHAMCSVPVCALQLADSARLQMWHMQWDEWVEGRAQGVRSLVETIEARLSDASTGGTAKVSELSSLYATLEEQNRELGEINVEAVGAERLAALQKGIQRFAALARYG